MEAKPKKISYCATHHTFPEPGEPCWQCANPLIDEAYLRGMKRGIKEGIKKGILWCAYWKDGVQYVGMGITLKEALDRLEEEEKDGDKDRIEKKKRVRDKKEEERGAGDGGEKAE